MLTYIFAAGSGLLLLFFGAEGLVRGSASLAFRLGVSALVIGLTVVAYGTSMPEMVVSIQASLSHQGAISAGNVIGSNIFNIAAILGLAALIRPLKVRIKLIRIDTPVLIGSAALFVLFFLDRKISRLEGLILFAAAVGYTLFNLLAAGKEVRKAKTVNLGRPRMLPLFAEIAFISGGFVLLVVGSRLFVHGSVGIARAAGLSEAVVGLTIIAAGTSLPELATSLVASFRHQADIAVGNVVGSNIFNILAVMGIAALISPVDGTGIGTVDLVVLMTASLILLPLLCTGFVLGRLEGGLLLAGYILYMGWLVVP
ncbi:MAG: calcium/sodium antiporter [Acidobacteriota bacterium]|nr:calcium/sodium antiporter [Candidatus Aminicenantes bacterium]